MSFTMTKTIPQPKYGGLARLNRRLLELGAILICAVFACAQTTINPATTTTEFGGQPNLTGAPGDFTTPRGGIVLYGTAISTITHHPVRHLWVGDNVFGLCRTDPEIDAP